MMGEKRTGGLIVQPATDAAVNLIAKQLVANGLCVSMAEARRRVRLGGVVLDEAGELTLRSRKRRE